MKVILKANDSNDQVRMFFEKNILPILNFGIAFEETQNIIIVHKKISKKRVTHYFDPTAEVIVELPQDVIKLAIDLKIDKKTLRLKSGEFYDEALAIRKLEETKRFFSVEYYSCKYSIGKKFKTTILKHTKRWFVVFKNESRF